MYTGALIPQAMIVAALPQFPSISTCVGFFTECRAYSRPQALSVIPPVLLITICSLLNSPAARRYFRNLPSYSNALARIFSGST